MILSRQKNKKINDSQDKEDEDRAFDRDYYDFAATR